jgi:hypothetical protein
MDKKIIGKVLKKAGELFEGEPSEQILLVEYKACQDEAHYYGTTCWTIIGIFLSFITAVVALIIKNILETNDGLLNSDANERWVIFGLSLLAITIIFFLFLWLKRTNKFKDKADERARGIAEQLKMQLNTNMKEIQKKGNPLRGIHIACGLFILVSIPWIFLAIISASKCIKVIILG